jgi:hypothetical protein
MRYIKFTIVLKGTEFRDTVIQPVHNNATDDELDDMADAIIEGYLDRTEEYMPMPEAEDFDTNEAFEERYEEAYNETYWNWNIRWSESSSEELGMLINKKREKK